MRIELNGAKNTRDLGGIITADGRKLRSCRLIRSGGLSQITDADVSLLRSHNLVHIIDLRNPAEQLQRPDVAIDGVLYSSLPLISDQAIGITREKNVIEQMVGMLGDPDFDAEHYMQGIYADFITSENCAKQLGEFFRILLDTQGGAVLWHCSAGKDRVGVTTALLLTALGVSREEVFRDYLRTNDYLISDVAPAAASLHKKIGGSLAQITDTVTTLYTVKESYLRSVFDAAEASCGSIDAYLAEALGITPALRSQLRKLYLEP